MGKQILQGPPLLSGPGAYSEQDSLFPNRRVTWSESLCHRITEARNWKLPVQLTESKSTVTWEVMKTLPVNCSLNCTPEA